MFHSRLFAPIRRPQLSFFGFGDLTVRVMFFAVALLFLTGCEQVFQDRNVQAMQSAEKKLSEGDYESAIRLYEDALDGTAKTAEVHYKLGLIYDDKLEDRMGAIHHFKRYLEFAPKGPRAKEARGFVKEDELKLAASLLKGGTMTQEDAARLKNDNLALRKQITELRAQPRGVPLKGGSATATQKPIPPGAKTYVVQSGDTLASISRKFFKNPERWKDIQDANFNSLEGTAKLKPGMTLIIP